MTSQPIAPSFACDPGALEITQRLRRAGYETYLVGGCVRDVLMGTPPKDWDIATAATPEQVEALFERTIPVGKAFGVMIVLLPQGEYEVATFRGDGDYSDGRRPDGVVFAGAERDVKRRDFTVNALMADPVTGEVIDWVGGVADIRAGLMRTVGDPRERFAEDYLRLLRAVRFAARTGFRLDPDTAAAVTALAPMVTRVSVERIGDEITRMLTEGASRPSLELLFTTGLLTAILPEVVAMAGVEQPPEYHPEGDVWVHTLIMLGAWDDAVTGRQPGGMPGLTGEPRERQALAWAILLHDIGKPATMTRSDRIRFNGHDALGQTMATAVLRRLRRPNWLIQAVEELVGGHMRFIHIREMRPAKRRRFAARDLYPLHLELHRLDCLGSHGKMDGYEDGVAAYREEQARPPPRDRLINGHDLIAVGYEPGPRLGRILEAVEDARLEGVVDTADEAMAWAHAHFPLHDPE